MPTARELLEQADALMRRNRRRGKDKRGPSTLTDVLADRSSVLAPTVILPDALRTEADPLVVAANAEAASDPIALETLSDVPVLTDVVDVWPKGQVRHTAQTEVLPLHPGLDDALEADALAGSEKGVEHASQNSVQGALEERRPAVTTDETSSTGLEALARGGPVDSRQDVREDARLNPPDDAEASAHHEILEAGDAVEAPRTKPLDEEFILDIPPLDMEDEQARAPAQAASPDSAANVVAAEVRRGTPDWDAMAEEIRMQVLQRLDLLTDAGMRDRLGERLRPIVDRASEELVETINQELGELVRNCVAEAIEREIDSWKKGGT